MTLPEITPEGQLRQPQPWAPKDGCQICWCTNIETVSLYGGKRCVAHPDSYDPDVPVRLRLGGWSEDADAYIRTWENHE